MEKHERRVESTVEAPEEVPIVVTLTFRRPYHDQELTEALNASKYLAAIWNMDQWLRNEIKHGDDCSWMEHLQKARDKFWEFLDDEGVVLE